MVETIEMVRQFHDAFELNDHTNDTPTIPDMKTNLMRVQSLIEEVAELAHALGNGDLVEVLDALTDIQYFLDGTYIACGMAEVKQKAFEEVHRSNMTKLDERGKPVRDAAGRVQKMSTYQPPRLGALVNVKI